MKRKFIEYKCKFCGHCADIVDEIEQHIDDAHPYCITCKKRFKNEKEHVENAGKDFVAGKHRAHLQQVIGHYESFLDKIPVETLGHIAQFLPSFKDCLSFNVAYKRFYKEKNYRMRAQCQVMMADTLYTDFNFTEKKKVCEEGVRTLYYTFSLTEMFDKTAANNLYYQAYNVVLHAASQNNWKFLQRYLKTEHFGEHLNLVSYAMLYLLGREPKIFLRMLYEKKWFRTCCILAVYFAEHMPADRCRKLFGGSKEIQKVADAIEFVIDNCIVSKSLRNSLLSALLDMLGYETVYMLPQKVCARIVYEDDYSLARLFLTSPKIFFTVDDSLIATMAKEENLTALRWLLSKECVFKLEKPRTLFERVFFDEEDAVGGRIGKIRQILSKNTFSPPVTQLLLLTLEKYG